MLHDSVDVAVFSLALMGTDYGSFLLEAERVGDGEELGGGYSPKRVWLVRCTMPHFQ
jgi:hypothetical protein